MLTPSQLATVTGGAQVPGAPKASRFRLASPITAVVLGGLTLLVQHPAGQLRHYVGHRVYPHDRSKQESRVAQDCFVEVGLERGHSVLQQHHIETTGERTSKGRVDAGVRRDSAKDNELDSTFTKSILQNRPVERVVRLLVDFDLVRPWITPLDEGRTPRTFPPNPRSITKLIPLRTRSTSKRVAGSLGYDRAGPDDEQAHGTCNANCLQDSRKHGLTSCGVVASSPEESTGMTEVVLEVDDQQCRTRPAIARARASTEVIRFELKSTHDGTSLPTQSTTHHST